MAINFDHAGAGARTGDNSIPGGQLRAIVERLERVEAEIKGLNQDKSDIYSEAKSAGFDTKIVRKVVALRRKDFDARLEEAALIDLYMAELGG